MNRREILRVGAASAATSVAGWFEPIARAMSDSSQRKRSCILLWMNGGPSTIDLFDLKTGQPTGGPTKPIKTNVPGLEFGEHLPGLAKWADRTAIVRSLNSREGDHARATYVMRTGNAPMGSIQYPSIGGLLAKELGHLDHELPPFVSIAPQRFFNQDAYSSGYLGPAYEPLIVGEVGFNRPAAATLDDTLKVKYLNRPKGVTDERGERRVRLLQEAEREFATSRNSKSVDAHTSAYERSIRLMSGQAAKAFDLASEKSDLRDRYGRTLFGQGCLLARRLIERGVPFVEVTLDGWDTHTDNFAAVKRLGGELDKGWSTLMADLKDRGLLDSTLIVWMGEFGRTPRINPQNGRDHFPAAFSGVLAGGGIKGGSTVGKTTPDGIEIAERPTSVVDFLATICLALGVDPEKQNMSNVGRPIRIVDKSAKPLSEILA